FAKVTLEQHGAVALFSATMPRSL
ncbi:class I SAM-dependent methyltransferase, partial [Salmonella enterica subsp. enterica serovar Enteritidis]|nr:class I SAM-dependent methyltransferase [Salmonella enterica subsp. enterica serovar Enteritidis]HAW6479306.1 class I SAM-dependent methyltransferase [Salmonella enterica subsp. enterica serovar Enteritidis]